MGAQCDQVWLRGSTGLSCDHPPSILAKQARRDRIVENFRFAVESLMHGAKRRDSQSRSTGVTRWVRCMRAGGHVHPQVNCVAGGFIADAQKLRGDPARSARMAFAQTPK